MKKKKYSTPIITVSEKSMETFILAESKKSGGDGVGAKETSFDFEDEAGSESENINDWSE